MTTEAPAAPMAQLAGKGRDKVSRWSLVGAALVVGVGVVLRLHSPSALWLDEAISVSISSQPLSEVPGALRHDGAPPLYALVLWAWLRVFDSSADAARALSALLGIAALPLAALCGRRLAGASGAVAAAVLLASSPFAIYYSGEARMYSLVVLLVLLGFLALDRFLTRPTAARGLPVAALSGALALTHYWSLFLLATTAAALLVRGIRHRRRNDLLALGWIAGGGLLFLPWLPSFRYQQAHTGTPWALPPPVSAVLTAVVQWCGLPGSTARLLAGLLVLLAVVGACAVGMQGSQLELDLRGRPPGAGLALVAAGTLVLGVVVAKATGAAFAVRYSSVAFPLFLLCAALGIARLPRAARPALLIAAASLGLAGSLPQVLYGNKTQAPVLAAALRDEALPGDVVVYCPDQLGPDTSRLLPAWLHQEAYPSGGSPARVDWVDYARRNRSADPVAYAKHLSARASAHAVWLVSQPGYRTYGAQCQSLAQELTALRGRPTLLVRSDPSFYEKATVTGWPPDLRQGT